jgi:hypothetical protein
MSSSHLLGKVQVSQLKLIEVNQASLGFPIKMKMTPLLTYWN